MEKEFKKPELTPVERNRANGLWTLLSSRRGNFKKDEMCSYFVGPTQSTIDKSATSYQSSQRNSR